MISVTVNGQSREVPAGLDLEGLLFFLGLDPSRVAVEHNGAIVPRSEYADTVLREGDRIEVVHFVQGGGGEGPGEAAGPGSGG